MHEHINLSIHIFLHVFMCLLCFICLYIDLIDCEVFYTVRKAKILTKYKVEVNITIIKYKNYYNEI